MQKLIGEIVQHVREAPFLYPVWAETWTDMRRWLEGLGSGSSRWEVARQFFNSTRMLHKTSCCIILPDNAQQHMDNASLPWKAGHRAPLLDSRVRGHRTGRHMEAGVRHELLQAGGGGV